MSTVKVQRSLIAFVTVMALGGAVWFGGMERATSQAQNATPTLLPDQVTAIAATMAAINATATAVAVPMYDDFSESVLDGNKWINASDFECHIEPRNDVLTIANPRADQSLNCSLEVNAQRFGMDALSLVEAQVMIADDHNRLELNQGIELSIANLAQPIYLFCGLNAEGSNLDAVAAGEILIAGEGRGFYTASDAVSVAYNEFHTFRWVVDAANLTATCLVDGAVIEVIPLDGVDGIEQAEFLVALSSYRSAGAVATTSLDNVVIAPA